MSFPELAYSDSAIDAATNADVIVVVTPWPEFADVDTAKVAAVVSSRVVVDACQGLRITAWREAGWQASSLTGLTSDFVSATCREGA